jgi:hypothetical protein
MSKSNTRKSVADALKTPGLKLFLLIGVFVVKRFAMHMINKRQKHSAG